MNVTWWKSAGEQRTTLALSPDVNPSCTHATSIDESGRGSLEDLASKLLSHTVPQPPFAKISRRPAAALPSSAVTPPSSRRWPSSAHMPRLPQWAQGVIIAKSSVTRCEFKAASKLSYTAPCPSHAACHSLLDTWGLQMRTYIPYVRGSASRHGKTLRRACPVFRKTELDAVVYMGGYSRNACCTCVAMQHMNVHHVVLKA